VLRQQVMRGVTRKVNPAPQCGNQHQAALGAAKVRPVANMVKSAAVEMAAQVDAVSAKVLPAAATGSAEAGPAPRRCKQRMTKAKAMSCCQKNSRPAMLKVNNPYVSLGLARVASHDAVAALAADVRSIAK
jgi:hypothetical protein